MTTPGRCLTYHYLLWRDRPGVSFPRLREHQHVAIVVARWLERAWAHGLDPCALTRYPELVRYAQRLVEDQREEHWSGPCDTWMERARWTLLFRRVLRRRGAAA